MEIKEFIEKFAEAIETENVDSLNAKTKFRELEEWSSLSFLSVIAMIDEEYDIQIENVNFKKLQTIGELFSYIESHK